MAIQMPNYTDNNSVAADSADPGETEQLINLDITDIIAATSCSDMISLPVSRSVVDPWNTMSDSSSLASSHCVHDSCASQRTPRIIRVMLLSLFIVCGEYLCIYTVSQKNCANLPFALICLSNINRFQ